MANSNQIDELSTQIIEHLRQGNESLSTAESLTAGDLSSTIVAVAGASDVFMGGITAYSDRTKTALLSVDPELMQKFSAVSQEVAIAMAKGALEVFGTTWAISTTGVAGPKTVVGHEVGDVWIAIAGPICQTFKLSLSGERETVRKGATSNAIEAFARILRDRKPLFSSD